MILVALWTFCPAAAYAQGGGEAPPGGTPTPTPPAPELRVERRAASRSSARARRTASCSAAPGTSARTTAFVGEGERWFEQDDLTGWTRDHGPAQLERHRHHREPPERRLVPQGVHAAALAEGGEALLEGPLRGQQLPDQGVAERQAARVLHRLLPVRGLLENLRKGRNTLVVEVSSLRSNSDLTHWRPAAYNGFGTGGWWNFGGILREVYVRRVDTVDVEDVQVLPRLRRVGGAAKVEVRTMLRNFTNRDRDVSLDFRVDGRRIRMRPRDGARARPARAHEDRFTIKSPRLWAPGSPELYDMTVGALTDRTVRSTYRRDVRRAEDRPAAGRRDPAERQARSTCAARASTRTTSARAARSRSARGRCS